MFLEDCKGVGMDAAILAGHGFANSFADIFVAHAILSPCSK